MPLDRIVFPDLFFVSVDISTFQCYSVFMPYCRQFCGKCCLYGDFSRDRDLDLLGSKCNILSIELTITK